MKMVFFAFFIIISSAVVAQDKACSLWLGNISDSSQNIKQFAEQYLEIPTKLLPAEAGTVQVMQDDNELAQITIWLKPKKMLIGGAMATVYSISSFKIISLSDKIDKLYTALAGKVQACTTATTAMNTVFGNGKIFIVRNSGGFGKNGLPMSTLTVTAN